MKIHAGLIKDSHPIEKGEIKLVNMELRVGKNEKYKTMAEAEKAAFETPGDHGFIITCCDNTDIKKEEPMESLFPKCNRNTDTATPSQRCDGTLLPIILDPRGNLRYELVMWKCSECSRIIKLFGKEGSME